MNKASGAADLAISPRLKMMVALMSDKAEMVSVPRELLERINRVAFLPVALASDLWDVLSAPAEDVRAVAEEPAGAYQAEITSLEVRLSERDKLIDHIALMINKSQTPNQVPQRPVVLAERFREVWLFLDGQAELNGCFFGEKPEGRHNFWWRKELREAIEEVERLNK